MKIFPLPEMYENYIELINSGINFYYSEKNIGVAVENSGLEFTLGVTPLGRFLACKFINESIDIAAWIATDNTHTGIMDSYNRYENNYKPKKDWEFSVRILEAYGPQVRRLLDQAGTPLGQLLGEGQVKALILRHNFMRDCITNICDKQNMFEVYDSEISHKSLCLTLYEGEEFFNYDKTNKELCCIDSNPNHGEYDVRFIYRIEIEHVIGGSLSQDELNELLG